MLHDGRHKETYRPDKGYVPVLAMEVDGEAIVVRRDEVKKYVNDPEFLVALNYWHYTKLWGLPNGQGWANEPLDVLEAITAIELETKTIEALEMEKVKHDSRRSQNHVHR